MNSDHFCANCAYWMRPHAESGGVGCQSRVECVNPCACPKFKLGYLYRGNLSYDEVHVENDEGWGFATGPLFGCIHFARRAIE